MLAETVTYVCRRQSLPQEVLIPNSSNKMYYGHSKQQESRRAYGTAVRRVVIHLNLIQLNCSEIFTKFPKKIPQKFK